MSSSPFHTRLVVALFTIYVLVQTYCIQQLSVNYDEASFYLYGVTLWKGIAEKDVPKFDSKLPITALNVLPRVVEQIFHPGLSKPANEEDILRGRYISLLIAVLLGLLLYRWTQQLYGAAAAIFSLCVYLLCPNFLAHGIFVSADIFAALFMMANLYWLWKYHHSRQEKDGFMAALALGLALVSKFTMIHLAIICVLLHLSYRIRRKLHAPAETIVWRAWLRRSVIYLGTIWLVIAAAHLFHGIGIPFNQYSFRSIPFQRLQQALHWVGDWLPVPLPDGYVRSMDLVMYYDRLGGGMPGSLNGATYLLGKSSTQGFPYYYWVVLFFKWPLTTLLLFMASLMLYFKSRPKAAAGFWTHEIYLFVPALYYLVYGNLFYSTQIGIRHILMVLPLCYIFIGRGFSLLRHRLHRNIAYGLLLLQLLSIAAYFPHFLPYTNACIRDKKMAYATLADTNLCYGEGKKFLQAYLQQHPEAVYLPAGIQSGKVVMEVNEMLDHNIRTVGRYRWVRGLVPSGHLHSQYLIFDISPATADSLKRIYPH